MNIINTPNKKVVILKIEKISTEHIAKKFSELYLNWKFEKNAIYELPTDRYIPY